MTGGTKYGCKIFLQKTRERFNNKPNGSIVKLVNDKNSYLCIYYKDGNFYYQTEEQYESNPNKFQLTYNKKKQKRNSN